MLFYIRHPFLPVPHSVIDFALLPPPAARHNINIVTVALCRYCRSCRHSRCAAIKRGEERPQEHDAIKNVMVSLPFNLFIVHP
jgi:hypothetical protein